MKLLIGIPTGGQPTRPFLDALRELALPPGVDDADRVVWTGNLVAVQREMIARDAVEDAFEALPKPRRRDLDTVAEAVRRAVRGTARRMIGVISHLPSSWLPSVEGRQPPVNAGGFGPARGSLFELHSYAVEQTRHQAVEARHHQQL